MASTLEVEAQIPVNNVYWVPILDVSFLPCLEGNAVGYRETRTFKELNSLFNCVTF